MLSSIWPTKRPAAKGSADVRTREQVREAFALVQQDRAHFFEERWRCDFDRAQLATPTPYFDAAWYSERYRSVAGEEGEPTSSYFMDYVSGELSRRNPNPWFEEVWYRERWVLADWLEAHPGFGALDHYLLIGRGKGLDPGPRFSEKRYLQANDDVLEAKIRGKVRSGFEHWLEYGRAEGRSLGHDLVGGHVRNGYS